jgi:CRP-like cAMP-binding protein
MAPELLNPLLRRWEKRCPLSDRDREALLSLPWTERSFNRDKYMVREGGRSQDCALLLTGLAFRQKLLPQGTRQIISIHIPGEFIDLQNCLLGIADHNVQSLTRVEAATVPGQALCQLAEDRPAVGRAMWLDTLIDASIFREWVVNVGRRDGRTRIAHLLCELALRLEASGFGGADTYDFPLTQEQLADATGMTAVHTNRVLQGLRQEKLIDYKARSLTILDWERLRDVGEFSELYLHHAA